MATAHGISQREFHFFVDQLPWELSRRPLSYRCGLGDGLSRCAGEAKEFIGAICRSFICSTMHILNLGRWHDGRTAVDL